MSLDPLKVCPTICSYVDSYLCNINTCKVIESFFIGKEVIFNEKQNGYIRKYENGMIYIVDFEYLDEYCFNIKDYNKLFFIKKEKNGA